MKLLLLLFIFIGIDHSANANIDHCLKKWDQEKVPQTLSETCLYKDINHKLVYSDYMTFIPKYPLFTDGMEKQRWIYIPKNKKIDVDDVDNWNFPQGTILFKEFSKNGIILETRVLYKAKVSMSTSSWKWATYMWNINQTNAKLVTRTVRNVLGTIHTIPSRGHCFSCHRGAKDMVLGFGAIQLSYLDSNSRPKGQYLKGLIDSNRTLGEIKSYYKIPAKNENERKALGYMHANCSHCHNQNHPMGGLGMHLKSKTSFKSRSEHEAIKTTIGVYTRGFYQADFRVEASNSEDSAIYMRLNSTQRGVQMAPIGKSTIDHDGVKIIKDWIDGL